MTKDRDTDDKTDGRPARDSRLKAALKANIARRKAQARARAAAADDGDDGQT